MPYLAHQVKTAMGKDIFSPFSPCMALNTEGLNAQFSPYLALLANNIYPSYFKLHVRWLC